MMPNKPSFDQLKILSDPRRLAILRLLMAQTATLTQLGIIFGQHPAWVRHHIKALQDSGLVVLDHTISSGGRTEKFYRAAVPALLVQQAILPEPLNGAAVLLMGSHDIALETGLGSWSEENSSFGQLVNLSVGSLDGLVALRQGLCHIAGCHLVDIESESYNIPYIQRIFPDRDMLVITLAEREQGLLAAQGNPLQVRSLKDLERGDVRFINRQRGSGTRLWLDHQLFRQAIPTEKIKNYMHEVSTHNATAAAILNGQADAGIGVHAAARSMGLAFTPLFLERYDLVMPRENTAIPFVQALLEHINSAKFREKTNALGGYDTAHTGSQQNTLTRRTGHG